MPIGLILDPDGSSIDLNDHTLYRLKNIDLPEPPVKSLYTGSFDTEGSLPASEHGYENREITIELMVFGGDHSGLLTLLSVLNEKLGKVNREGGELQLTFPDETVIIFDLLQAATVPVWQHSFVTQYRTDVTLSFVAKPFWRKEETSLGTFSETSLPVLTAVLPAIDGDVPALGRMVVTDTGGDDRWSVVWGLQSQHYDPSVLATLFYEAETRTALGGAATAVGAAGASGAGSNVMRQGTLTPGWQAVLSTKLNGGQHLTHIGSFEVLARVYMPTTNTGAVSLFLEWSQGDFLKRTANPAVDFDADHPREGAFVIVRLGQVHIDPSSTRWEGRIVASSTVSGDDLDLDWISLVPVGEGSGELSAVQQFENPTSFSARDEFDQSAGALTGKTAAVGGVWTFLAGDTDDFQVEATGHTVQRTSTTDTGTTNEMRIVYAATPTLTATAAQVDLKTTSVASGLTLMQGVVLRIVDASNYMYAVLRTTAGTGTATRLRVAKVVAGAHTVIQDVQNYPLGADAWHTLRVTVDAAGRYFVWVFPTASMARVSLASGQDSALATGGALASGKVGIGDRNGVGSAVTRSYDNFLAFLPTVDAAIYANQSMELTHEGARREDSTGAVWSRVSNVEGSYLRLMPGGREERVNRLIVIPLRNDPDTGDPGGAADLSVPLSSTARGVSIPSP